MALGSSLLKWLKAIFKKLLKFIKEFIKKFWWVILIVVAIYFAPLALAYLTSMGAPTFLTTAVEFVAVNLTPLVTGAVEWVAGGASSMGSSAWSAFKAAELGTQAAVVVGTGALLAPEETSKVIGDAAGVVGDVTGTVLEGVVSGLGSGSIGTVVMYGALAYLAFIFVTKDKGQPRAT